MNLAAIKELVGNSQCGLTLGSVPDQKEQIFSGKIFLDFKKNTVYIVFYLKSLKPILDIKL